MSALGGRTAGTDMSKIWTPLAVFAQYDSPLVIINGYHVHRQCDVQYSHAML